MQAYFITDFVVAYLSNDQITLQAVPIEIDRSHQISEIQVSDDGTRGATRGGRSVPRRVVRGHQPVLHPRQKGHHHAEGHVARQKDQGR